MAFKIFLIYSVFIIIFLNVALAAGWKIDFPSGGTGSSGSSGYRGSSGAWGWGGGK